MRLRTALLITVFLTLSSNLLAVAPQFWRVHSLDELLAGEDDGFAITSRGELRPGPSVRKVASFSDPFVLAQASAPNGDHFFGTGNNGQIYRLRGTELKAIYKAAEPEIYAIAAHNGAVYAASSPNGKIYRIDPNDGKATVFFDPKQAYIWALQVAPNGDLIAGTGVEGKLFRITPQGEGKLIFTVPETHVRSLALRRDGTILAGGSGKGRIYEIRPDGTTHALYDSPLTEISAIYVDSNGVGWAAAASTVLPASAPKPAVAAKPAQAAAGSSSTTEAKSESNESSAAPAASVSFSFDEGTAGAQPGSGELYKINPDGFVESVRKFDREMVYAIGGGPNGSILLSTGPQGRVYSFKNGEMALVATVPEKQIVSLDDDRGATLITTTNSGAVYRMDTAPSTRAEYRSVAKDVEHFSSFGHYRIEGDDVGGGRVAISFRSGNTKTPDSTWTPWSSASTQPEGSVGAPPGRYLQWKLTMPQPAADVAVDSVTVGYINRNVAPVIDAVSVLEPGVVMIGSSYPASPQVLEATNPDEYGIFTSLDNPREKNEPGKKLFRRGYRTITWRAHDDNGDNLRYSLLFRAKGSEKWLRLRDNLDENQMNFDTSQLPDGTYELRIVASDALENPEMPLTDAREGIDFVVDNAAPTITVTPDGSDVLVRVTDKLSTIGKVEYSSDAQKWVRLVPTDGVADSRDETYKLSRSAVAGKFVVIRAVDSFYNVATASVSLP
jgi:hypothetical protein